MDLLYKLRFYTRISSPEKSRNNTREKMRYFFTCVLYRQSAADTSLAFRATRSNWWMNIKAFTTLNTRYFYRNFLGLWWLKHRKNPYRSNQIAALGYVSYRSERRFLRFERCSNFNEVMGDSERAVHIMDSSEWEMLAFLCFNVYFIALYEECDTTGRMKDIRLPILNVLLLPWKWWIVVREKLKFCAL